MKLKRKITLHYPRKKHKMIKETMKYKNKKRYIIKNNWKNTKKNINSKFRNHKLREKTYKTKKNKKYKGGNNKSKSFLNIKSKNILKDNLNNSNTKFKYLNCAPKSGSRNVIGFGNINKDYTCYSSSSLEYMKEYWNKRHPDLLINTNNPKEIWKLLKKNMNNVCDRESCWLKQNFIKNNLTRELTQSTFAPESPSTWKRNKNQWLTSLDIDRVMKQYEDAYKCFEFIGPSPIDFDSHQKYNECVWEELCKFDLSNYINKGKTKIGIIFNTDPHYKEGSHWISLFINIKDNYIFYFDSNGDDIPKEIKKLIERIKSQATQLGIHFKTMDNYQIEHQNGNSECGMYSLYFIIQLLTENKPPNYFLNERIKDEEMEKLRNKYFNSNL